MTVLRAPLRRFVLRFLLALATLVAVPAALPAALPEGEGAEVVVVYNSRVPASRVVAGHYARRRGVPAGQVVGFDLPEGGQISRTEYAASLQDPLREWLSAQGLCRWTSEPIPPLGDVPARRKYTLEQSRIRYLVLCLGVPWYIPNDPAYRERTNGVPDALRRNDACVDNEICLLPRLGHYEFVGLAVNPFASLTNAAKLHPVHGAFIVSRLDGPTPEVATGLVDKAVEAEARGLWGHAYVDLRNIRSGPYAKGDEWITNAATAARRLGFETFVDNRPELFPKAYPMSQIGLYVGWYSALAEGPFTRRDVEFQPGAFAYHLHSFSAGNLRAPDQNWVGPFLARGVTCTMGCVAEPYLDFSPHPAVFLERWGFLGMTFGEAAATCHPVLSWQTVVIGDPLYRPFRLNPLQYGEMLAMGNDLRAGFALVRAMNAELVRGRPPQEVAESMETKAFATNSAVVTEKIGRIYGSEIRLAKALEWYALALRLPDCSPLQRTRLLMESADYARILDRPREALGFLEEVVARDPEYPDLLGLRTRQLALAREIRDADRVAALQGEIARLTPPATNAPPK